LRPAQEAALGVDLKARKAIFEDIIEAIVDAVECFYELAEQLLCIYIIGDYLIDHVTRMDLTRSGKKPRVSFRELRVMDFA
jgi:hypothetical protein